MRNTQVSVPFCKAAKLALSALAILALAPMTALADTADEIKAMIIQDNAEVREKLAGSNNGYSKYGSVEFWSSGGLMHSVAADSPIPTWESFSLTPKHIEVVTLVEDQAAVAMYYSEGSFHETGQSPVSHYMTRVTDVYVKEDGKWKLRAAHYSPIAAGQGTRQTSVE
ncbi:MAG: hypothetical protein ACI8Z9_001678 [Paraglaciecola sp.]|jgi:hypothetical protein